MGDPQKPNKGQNRAEKLAQCHPAFAEALRAVIKEIEHEFSCQIRLVETYRSPERQAKLMSQGLSKDAYGFHNTTRHGVPYACAADLVDRTYGYRESAAFFAMLAIKANKYGLMTGVTFGLPPNVRNPIEHEIKAANQEALTGILAKKRGWDPLHVQPGREMYLKIMQEGLDSDPGWP